MSSIALIDFINQHPIILLIIGISASIGIALITYKSRLCSLCEKMFIPKRAFNTICNSCKRNPKNKWVKQYPNKR